MAASDDATKTFGQRLIESLPLEADKSALQSELKSLGMDVDWAPVTERACLNNESTTTEGKSTSPLMDALQSKLSDYTSSAFQEGVTARFSLELPDPNVPTVVEARTYAEHVDPHNCKTGRWSCVWTIEQPADTQDAELETTATVSGTCQLHVHYYENNSNVQLRCTRNFRPEEASTAEEKVNALVARMEARKLTYEQKVAQAVVKKIQAHHDTLYRQLFQEQEILSDGAATELKKLRRILPVTKTRFKWDAAAQKQVQLLNARKTA